MFQEYYELGLSVIPVLKTGKSPIVSNWSKYCTELPSQEDIDRWDKGDYNIGVACGPASGIVVLDIDTDDKDILALCPTSPIVRRGQKGECRFFKYNPKIVSQSIPLIDILSLGRQVLIPPSIHPTTKLPYRWLSVDTLENFDVKDLPELDLAFMSKLSKKVSIDVPGRNNKLVDIVSSMRGRGEPEQSIVSEVYNWDKNFHTPRLFLDASEKFKGKTEEDAMRNAWRLVNSVTKSLIENGAAVMAEDAPILILDEATPIVTHKFQEFPKAEGLIGDIAALIEGYSERQMPNLALGGAISVVAALSCNRFRFNDTWPNMYILNLAPTGAGKSFPQRIIVKLLDENVQTNLIGFGNYRSSSALVKNLVSRRERLDLIDEVASLFAQMKSGGLYQTEILDELCKLWTASSSKFLAGEYSEKENTSTCYNPCVNILGSSTIKGIKANMSRDMTEKGLMPRFLIFSHENYGQVKEDFLDEELMQKICLTIEALHEMDKPELKTKTPNLLQGPIYNPRNVAPKEKDAIAYFKEIKAYFDKSIEIVDQSDVMTAMLSRGKEHVMKLATVHAVGCGRIIQLQDLQWAKKVFDTCLYNSTMMLEETNTSNEHEKDVLQVLNYIKKTGQISHGKLQGRFRRVQPQRLKQITGQLIEDGSIAQFKVDKTGNTKEHFVYIAQ